MRVPAFVALVAAIGALSSASGRQNPIADAMFGNAAASTTRQALEAKVAAAPTDASAWLELAKHSYRYDEPEETITLIERGLADVPGAAALWRLLAEVHFADARSGPNWIERPGMTRGRKSKSELDEQAFRQKSFEAALGAITRVVELQPDDRAAAEERVSALFGLRRWAEADTVLQEMSQHWRTGELAARHGYCLMKLDRLEDARRKVKSALTLHPRCAELHFVHARLLELAGDSSGVQEAEARAEFYLRLLPESRVDYTPELGASMKRIFGKKEGTSGMFSDDRLNEEISAEIDALEARDDASSSELLASLALSHFAHGPLEDRAFRILGDRRDVARLLRIYSHARSHCTIGGCLRQLVRLRAGGVYEKLCATLSLDGGMFPIGVVSLLVELNDPRTPEPLIAYTEDRNAPFFEDALVALGHFDTAEARRHLERWVKDEEVAPFAAAGLYRMTEDQKWLQLVVRFMEKADTFEVWPIVASIRSIGTAEAKQLVAQFDAREAEEERARSERDQGKQ